jgi:hypothetical protein
MLLGAESGLGVPTILLEALDIFFAIGTIGVSSFLT